MRGEKVGDSKLDRAELQLMVKSLLGSLKLMRADHALSQQQSLTLVSSFTKAADDFLRASDKNGDRAISRVEFRDAISKSIDTDFGRMMNAVLSVGLPAYTAVQDMPTSSDDVAASAAGGTAEAAAAAKAAGASRAKVDASADAEHAIVLRRERRAAGDEMHRIVSLDGSGMRLFFQVGLMAALEQRVSGFCGSVDLWSGTGFSATAAALLAMGYAPFSVRSMFLTYAGVLLNKGKSLLQALKVTSTRFDPTPLREFLQQKLGNLKWRHLRKMAARGGMAHLIIPVFHLAMPDEEATFYSRQEADAKKEGKFQSMLFRHMGGEGTTAAAADDAGGDAAPNGGAAGAAAGDGAASKQRKWGLKMYSTQPMSQHFFKSSAHKLGSDDDFLWEVLLAAAATPTFFPPYKVTKLAL